ncbi:hypothetical protein M0813_16557 [Anaeramoeba flamelloides]|uniref:Uncharacterized protein n=1 Tax=Anaeramoeba flamelloides TaxID=1746091 RepID=A0ABQ8YZ09_9EUKA|nr:hypothetical protein M0813_16557 [Anaeramoeba flamelloides]
MEKKKCLIEENQNPIGDNFNTNLINEKKNNVVKKNVTKKNSKAQKVLKSKFQNSQEKYLKNNFKEQSNNPENKKLFKKKENYSPIKKNWKIQNSKKSQKDLTYVHNKNELIMKLKISLITSSSFLRSSSTDEMPTNKFDNLNFDPNFFYKETISKNKNDKEKENEKHKESQKKMATKIKDMVKKQKNINVKKKGEKKKRKRNKEKPKKKKRKRKKKKKKKKKKGTMLSKSKKKGEKQKKSQHRSKKKPKTQLNKDKDNHIQKVKGSNILKFKLNKNLKINKKPWPEYEVVPINFYQKNEYIKKPIKKIMKFKNCNKKQKKKLKNYYIIYLIANYFDRWGHNSIRKKKFFSKRNGLKNISIMVKKTFKDVEDLIRLGKVVFYPEINPVPSNRKLNIFQTGEVNVQNEIMKIKIDKKKKNILKEKIAKMKPQDLEIKILIQNIKIISFKSKKYDLDLLMKFQSDIESIRAIITFIYLIWSSDQTIRHKKNLRVIGFNPKRRLNSKRGINNKKFTTDLIKRIYPPMFPPSKKFLKKYSSEKNIDLKLGIEHVMEIFETQKGANFFVAIVNSKEYPLTPGYIKIRKKRMKIGLHKKTLYRIPWKSFPVILPSTTKPSLMTIKWISAHNCRESKEFFIDIRCKTCSHLNLIQKTIEHFQNNLREH